MTGVLLTCAHSQLFVACAGGVSARLRQQCARSAPLHGWARRLAPAGVRFRPSPATCGASMPRFGDRLSTGVRALRLFLPATPDGAFPVLQDALLWTYREVSSVRLWVVLSSSAQVRSGHTEHPTRNLPRYLGATDVLGYR